MKFCLFEQLFLLFLCRFLASRKQARKDPSRTAKTEQGESRSKHCAGPAHILCLKSASTEVPCASGENPLKSLEHLDFLESRFIQTGSINC